MYSDNIKQKKQLNTIFFLCKSVQNFRWRLTTFLSKSFSVTIHFKPNVMSYIGIEIVIQANKGQAHIKFLFAWDMESIKRTEKWQLDTHGLKKSEENWEMVNSAKCVFTGKQLLWHLQ